MSGSEPDESKQRPRLCITCPECTRTSYNPGDVAHRWCAACNAVTDGAIEVYEPATGERLRPAEPAEIPPVSALFGQRVNSAPYTHDTAARTVHAPSPDPDRGFVAPGDGVQLRRAQPIPHRRFTKRAEAAARNLYDQALRLLSGDTDLMQGEGVIVLRRAAEKSPHPVILHMIRDYATFYLTTQARSDGATAPADTAISDEMRALIQDIDATEQRGRAATWPRRGFPPWRSSPTRRPGRGA